MKKAILSLLVALAIVTLPACKNKVDVTADAANNPMVETNSSSPSPQEDSPKKPDSSQQLLVPNSDAPSAAPNANQNRSSCSCLDVYSPEGDDSAFTVAQIFNCNDLFCKTESQDEPPFCKDCKDHETCKNCKEFMCQECAEFYYLHVADSDCGDAIRPCAENDEKCNEIMDAFQDWFKSCVDKKDDENSPDYWDRHINYTNPESPRYRPACACLNYKNPDEDTSAFAFGELFDCNKQFCKTKIEGEKPYCKDCKDEKSCEACNELQCQECADFYYQHVVDSSCGEKTKPCAADDATCKAIMDSFEKWLHECVQDQKMDLLTSIIDEFLLGEAGCEEKCEDIPDQNSAYHNCVVNCLNQRLENEVNTHPVLNPADLEKYKNENSILRLK